MAGRKITVVISQAQGKNPNRRQLEETIAAELIMDSEIDVSVVPHIYDMSFDHTGMIFLRSVPGDVVFLSWLYPRATRWVLDRNGVRGEEGMVLLTDDSEDEEVEVPADDAGIGSVDVPKRKIYCIDLRVSADATDYLEEIRRIASEKSVQTVDLMDWIGGTPGQAQLDRYLKTPNNGSSTAESTPAEATGRRWYPVIDYSRCTNCMECIDFCLFGVYGVDQLDRILVDEQDNCKKGCPACSRVCPENAIMFPGHKSSSIAGADGEVGDLKIDLSKLFGAPDALEMAVRERDAELVADGRDAVGMSIGIPKRQTAVADRPRDHLDDLIDGLDDMDL